MNNFIFPRVFVRPNPHGSGRAALDKWLAGSLWGQPMQMGPDTFHVYGCHRGASAWRLCQVAFSPERIIVMILPRIRAGDTA